MKSSKYMLYSALVAAMITITGCSNTVAPALVSNESSLQITSQVQNTENTDISEQEIKEIRAMAGKSDLSFSVKTVDQGKDVSVDLLLYNPKAAKRAHFWGLDNANELLNSGSSPTKRWFLERKLGGLFPSSAFKVQVLFWVERADMLRIKNVSLDDSFLLVLSGITSVPHLARFNNIIDQSALKVQLSLLAFQYGMPIPSMDEIKSWTQEATTLAPVLY